MEKKKGGQPGNSNARRVQRGRVVLSVTEDILKPFIAEYQEKYGGEPGDEMIKVILKSSLQDRPRILHLYVDVQRADASEMKSFIESQFGQVETCYLTDSWYSEETSKRTIYYQRLLNPSRDGWEDWEDNGSLSDAQVEAGIAAIRQHPKLWNLCYRINDSDWYT